MQIFEKPCINWVWYIEVEENPDRTMTILRHYRLHCRRDAHPEEVDGTYLWLVEEEEGRIVTGIRFPEGDVREVSNPQYIFSYPNF